MKVKPTDPKAVIRDPHTKRVLPAEGGEVPDNIFWRRRLLAGEVVQVVDTKPAGGAPAPTTTKAER